MSAPPETPWILGSYGDAPSVRTLIDSFTSNKGPYSPLNTLSGLKKEDIISSARGFIESLTRKHLEHVNKTRIILKTPDDIHYLEKLLELFPNSKYIHIYRDGRDVACSTVGKKKDFFGEEFSKGFGPINHYNSVKRWFIWESKINEMLTLNSYETYETTYEELVTNTREVIFGLCHFLHVDFEDQMININSKKSIYPKYEAGSHDVEKSNDIFNNSINQYKSKISMKDIRKINNDFGDFIRSKGYDTEWEKDQTNSITKWYSKWF